ncbi:MAG: HEAT repeat domain-containing protein, partial [Pirellulales bacterium]
RLLFVPLLSIVASNGCGKREKSTPELIADLKSTHEKDRISAVRLLPGHKGDAAQVLPALIESLKVKEAHVRRSAAIGLGNFGDGAKEAIPALQAVLKDPDPRTREAAGVALSRIDPAQFTSPTKQPRPSPRL